MVEGGMGGYVSFSPDGKQLVYSDSRLIRTIEVEGTSRPRMMPDQRGKNKHPNWSPDGQWIVFSSDRDDL
jgi:Tol biopolymer transport system component